MSDRKQRIHAEEVHRSPIRPLAAAPEKPHSVAQDNAPDNAGTSHKIIQLQSTIGNAAVRRLIATGGIKPAASSGRLTGNVAKTMHTLYGDAAQGAQVHTDAAADSIAQGANSEATSIGNHVYFRAGAYRPNSAKGNALIAREMTHVARSDHNGNAAPDSAHNHEANALSEVVEALGDNPETTFQDAQDGTISRKQADVVQRVDTKSEKAAHVAGVVTSKFLQGLGNILGPIGIIWRWPLIKKNINEYTGATGKEKDIDRYGKGAAADFARFLSAFAEILKEMTIWLGLGTFIAAICAGASMGGAAVALVVMTAITATVGGLAALFKLYLLGHNAVRLALATDPKKIAMIKHQLFIDGMDFLANTASAVTAGFSAASAAIKVDGGSMSFAPSGGSDVAKNLGYEGAVAPVVGKMVNDYAVSPGTGIVANSVKEGGKVQYNTDPIKKEDKGFMGGLTKDLRQITGADGYNLGKKKPTAPVTAPVTSPSSTVPVVDDGASASQPEPLVNPSSEQTAQINDITSKLTEIKSASRRNSVDAGSGKKEADKTARLVKDNLGSFPSTVDKVDEVKGGLNDSKVALDGDNKKIDDNLSKLDENKAEALDEKVKVGLERAKSAPKIDGEDNSYLDADSKSDDEVEDGYEADIDEPEIVTRPRGRAVTRFPNVQRDGKKPGIGSRIKGWFGRRFSSLRGGMRKLNAFLVRGVMKLIGKFTKKAGDPKEHAPYVGAMLEDGLGAQTTETQNADMATQMATQADGMAAAFEKSKTQR